LNVLLHKIYTTFTLQIKNTYNKNNGGNKNIMRYDLTILDTNT